MSKRLLRALALPSIAIALVVATQLAAFVSPTVDLVARSFFGSFVQGVLVTLAFGQITVLSLAQRQRERHAEQIASELIFTASQNEGIDGTRFHGMVQKSVVIDRFSRGKWRDIENLPAFECAVFILAYQHSGSLLDLPGLDASRLSELAVRASHWSPYRMILLAASLAVLVPRHEVIGLAREIDSSSARQFASGGRMSEADLAFDEAISRAAPAEVLVVGSTSQTSKYGREFYERHAADIVELAMAHVSPRILSDAAIRGSLRELRVPDRVIPKHQQIPNEVADAVRRVVRVCLGLDHIWALQTNGLPKLTTYSLRPDRLPFKARLTGTDYVQFFPAGLDYASNLYRFGYEITETTLSRRLATLIRTWIAANSTAVRTQSEKDAEVQASLAELGRWLTGVPNSVGLVSENRARLQALLPEPASRNLLQAILDVLASGLAATISTDGVDASERGERIYFPVTAEQDREPRVITTANQSAHVSVGVLVRCNGRVLLVRKITEPNVGLWSIPAGHCGWGESASIAARRELAEETGIESSRMALVFSGEVEEAQLCRYGQSLHLWFLYALDIESEPQLKLSADELSGYDWHALDVPLSGTPLTSAVAELVERVPELAGLRARHEGERAS